MLQHPCRGTWFSHCKVGWAISIHVIPVRGSASVRMPAVVCVDVNVVCINSISNLKLGPLSHLA